jgi:ribosomal protein L11 methyltransferase
MLKAPYSSYQRLYTYHLEGLQQPFINDPDLIGIWPEGNTTILFFHRPKERLVRELCERSDASLVYQADLDYADWEAGGLPHLFVEQGMTIAPIWERKKADLYLDPSVVFGSGFHPSTRLCLGQLLETLKVRGSAIQSLLDLGCGSGLLSLAAAVKGVGRVTAVDNNQLACEVCQANAERNGIIDRLSILNIDLFSDFPNSSADLIIANLHPELLDHLMGQTFFWKSSEYILSGFMPSQEEMLLSLIPDHGFSFSTRKRKDKWCLWHLVRCSSVT